ncbi:MAG: hypothetical protein ACLFNK_00535 [Candidatus Woesearchaeota archaeon]
MEHACFISNPENIVHCENGKFDRLYFGNEFCDHLIPDIKQVENMIEWCASKKMKFTLVTPAFLSDEDIKTLSLIMDELDSDTEIVFNDYGLLEMIKRKKMIPVQGRVLSIVTRDPRKVEESENKQYVKLNSLMRPYQKKMHGLGVSRIELDNVKQGYSFDAEKDIHTSLYYPYVHCNITRNCMFFDKRKKTHDCREEPIPAKLEGADILIKGNVQYYINNKRPDARNWNLDRLVYMPVFPNDNSVIR